MLRQLATLVTWAFIVGLSAGSRPAYSRLGPWIAPVCEGGELHMVCPTSYKLKVEEAFFGRRDGSASCTTDDLPVEVRNCESTHGTDNIMALCENQDSCTVTADRAMFSTPCDGDYQLYLNVTFSCELPLMTTEICQGGTGEALCYQYQEIRMESARWGRSDGTTCNPDMVSADCDAEGDETMQILSEVCDGRERCDMTATTTYFGELPACSAPKYLAAEYTCTECANYYQDPAFEPHHHCEMWAYEGGCEDNQDWMYANCRMTCTHCDVTGRTGEAIGCWDESDAELMCAAGLHILVRDVYYGCAEDGSVCNGAEAGRDILNEERSEEPYRIAADICNGRKSCMVWPGPPTAFNLTSTCPSSETRYLKVKYTCEPCSNARTSDDLCMEWAGDHPSECSVNRDWMGQECFQACSGCSSAVTCDNGPHDDCDWWASQGECENNPTWMPENCARSCGTCCRNEVDTSWCDWWASQGECKTNPWWMKVNCADSCHSCCDNMEDDDACDWWTSQGECTSNPGYMHSNCAKSCGTCRVFTG